MDLRYRCQASESPSWGRLVMVLMSKRVPPIPSTFLKLCDGAVSWLRTSGLARVGRARGRLLLASGGVAFVDIFGAM